jgi:hypothetical protein
MHLHLKLIFEKHRAREGSLCTWLLVSLVLPNQTVVILQVKNDNWQFIWKISNLADVLKVRPYSHCHFFCNSVQYVQAGIDL